MGIFQCCAASAWSWEEHWRLYSAAVEIELDLSLPAFLHTCRSISYGQHTDSPQLCTWGFGLSFLPGSRFSSSKLNLLILLLASAKKKNKKKPGVGEAREEGGKQPDGFNPLL